MLQLWLVKLTEVAAIVAVRFVKFTWIPGNDPLPSSPRLLVGVVPSELLERFNVPLLPASTSAGVSDPYMKCALMALLSCVVFSSVTVPDCQRPQKIFCVVDPLGAAEPSSTGAPRLALNPLV